MSNPPFQSQDVLSEHISEQTLKAYHVGFDGGRFRLNPLADVIADVIPEFALGYPGHMSVPLAELRRRLKEAAERIYCTEQYSRRGEFGELILHLLLRDYLDSVPLVSKIYFKDSPNDNVKGFDAVHIVETDEECQLWLGESKLYSNGLDGVKALAQDVISHFQADYLRQEFSLISAKLPSDWERVEEWRGVLDQYRTLDSILDRVCVPLCCTYTSPIFHDHSENTPEYFDAFENECRTLCAALQSELPNTPTDVVLLLLPVECKPALVQTLHSKLLNMQSV